MLRDIERELRQLLLTDRPSRPFICDGSPLDCQVALVGVNPGTATPFWPYWNSETGFDRAAWNDAFDRDPENTKNETRPRLNVLVRELEPVKILELNVYPYFSKDVASLPKKYRDTCVFDYMLSLVRPRMIFVFGNDSIDELAALLGSTLPKGQFTSCTYKGSAFDVYADKHLSRGWSYLVKPNNPVPAVQSLARKLRRHLGNG